MRISISYSGLSVNTMGKLDKAMQAANEATAQFWQQNFRPIHFTDAAMERYGYQHRAGQDEPEYVPKNFAGSLARLAGRNRYRMIKNPRYYWRKKREGHGTTPLVYSGATKSATDNYKMVGSVKQAKITWPSLSRYFYQYRKDQKSPDKVDELLRVIDSEMQALQDIHLKTATETLEQLNQSEESETVVYAA